MGRLNKEGVNLEVFLYFFGKCGRAEITDWLCYWVGGCKSKIGKKVAQYTIEAETISLGETLEMAMFLREVWREISGDAVNIGVEE